MKGVSRVHSFSNTLIAVVGFGLVYTLVSSYTDVVEKLSGVKSIRVEVIGCGETTPIYTTTAMRSGLLVMLLRPKEACSLLGVSHSTFRRWIREGRIKAVQTLDGK